MRSLLFIAVILLSRNVCGQGIPFPFTDVSPELSVPAGDDTWVVEIRTRGGLDGRGTGDFLISSDGKLSRTFRDLPQDTDIKKETLRTFSAFIPPAAGVKWGESSFGTCMDCIATLIRLRIRGHGGEVKTFVAYWDDTTKRRVPEEILRLYKATVDLGK